MSGRIMCETASPLRIHVAAQDDSPVAPDVVASDDLSTLPLFYAFFQYSISISWSLYTVHLSRGFISRNPPFNM